MAWRGDGRLFAASGTDHRIYVWDTAANRLQSVLEGHQNTVVVLQFTHEGGLLLSSGWDSNPRVWDPVRGTNLVTMPAGLIRIGPDDRRVVRVEATPKGKRLLQESRGRRVQALVESLSTLSAADLKDVERAVGVLQRMLKRPGH